MFEIYFDENDLSLLKKIFNNNKFFLPIRWNGKDFSKTIREIFDLYLKSIQLNASFSEYKEVESIVNYLISAVDNYLKGSPSMAYDKISSLIKKYFNFFTTIDNPTEEYYRILKVDKNSSYRRDRIFHPPYSLRNYISTNRYSIPGYPCLYLSNSFKLCFREINYNPYDDYYIISKFKIADNSNVTIRLLDLSIKPQDLFLGNIDTKTVNYGYKNYIYVYPLLLVCSFIRSDKKAPFAPEYIVPQLLMECIKNMITVEDYNSIIGIKYFSCSSVSNSNMGYNVVFPTYKQKDQKDFCEVLNDLFTVTKPIIVNDYETLDDCKSEIDNIKDYKHIMNITKK